MSIGEHCLLPHGVWVLFRILSGLPLFPDVDYGMWWDETSHHQTGLSMTVWICCNCSCSV